MTDSTKTIVETTNNNTSGIGFSGLLTVLFIGLKLTGYIAWPWVWVLSPLWIVLALIIVGVLVAAAFI